MLQHICPACRVGAHDHCWKTKRPREGYLGGSTCVCPDPGHAKVCKVGELPVELAEKISESKMSPEHNHLDDELIGG